MSTPPVPPANQDEPESGGQNAPQHGQNTPPQYGQNAPQQPQYGQNAPQYGQNAPQQPQYGAPQYGQNAPQYGQNAPQYGQNAPQQPQYGQNAPQYGQNPAQQQFGQNQFGQPQQGQSPYGQAPYGQSPYSQYPSELPSSSSPVPQLVNISFYLLILSAVVAVLSILLVIPSLDDPGMRRQFEDQLAAQGQGEVPFEDLKAMIVGVLVVFAVITAGLYALVAFNVRKGKNWARILGTVFAALSIFGLFSMTWATIGTAAGIAAIVLLYLPGAAPYFSKQQPSASPYSQPYGR